MLHSPARVSEEVPCLHHPVVSVRWDTMRRVNEEENSGSLPLFAECVLELVERIPSGRVMTYGDVAEYLEQGGPRQVGRVMTLYGAAVPWWRVVRSDGALLPGHELRALDHYRAEGTPLRSVRGRDSMPRIDLGRARWDGNG
jgi:alkylated DNA nucleotide flippase Atl1